MASNNLKGGERYRAGLPTLGARLLAAANAVRPGRPAADIGCDHGKLAVWLALRGISPRVIAVDSRPLPLAKARALAAQTGCADVVACRLGDGLAALAPGEAQEIIIAGLSGETIIALLDACAGGAPLGVALASALDASMEDDDVRADPGTAAGLLRELVDAGALRGLDGEGDG